VERSEKHESPQLQRALALAEEGDWDSAVEVLREALDADPDDPYTLCWLGVAEMEVGSESVAFERFRRCLAMDPTDPNLLATAGSALAQLDDPAAEAALRSAALLGPDLALTRMLYGAYLVREGLFDQGLEELAVARELAPEDPVVRAELGVALSLNARQSEAIDQLEEGARLDPGNAWIRGLLGLELYVADQPVEAAGELSEAARLLPHDSEMHVLAALAAHRAEAPDYAFERLEHARMAAGPDDLPLVLEAEEAMDSDDAVREFLDDLAAASLRRRRLARP